MISHSINIFKPPVPVGTVWAPTRYQQFANQEEYDKYISGLKFIEGDFITMSSTQITNPYMIHCITRIERNWDKLTYSAHSNEVKPLFVIGCNMETPTPWVRWDTFKDYRLLTQEEYDKFIIPNRDKLQDHCTKWG